MRVRRSPLLAGLALALAIPSRAGVEAASVSSDVDVALPEVLALYCYDEVDVAINAGDAATTSVSWSGQVSGAQSSQWNVQLDAEEIDGGPALDDAVDLPREIELTLSNVCAVRAVLNGPGAQVVVTRLNPKLVHPSSNGTFIRVTAANVRDGGVANAPFAPAFLMPRSNLSWTDARPLDVRLSLRMNRASASGTYSSARDGTFRVTVTAL